MAKTRMEQGIRKRLRSFAAAHVTTPKETRAHKRAYDKASKLVRQCVDKQFPPEDMAVLDKYDLLRADSCIRGGGPDGNFVAFRFYADDERIPNLPAKYCSSRSVRFTRAAVDAVAAYERTFDAETKARLAKLEPYYALIAGARTVEDVLEVWPAAKAALPADTALPATLSREQIEAIRRDNAGADAEPGEETEAEAA